VAIPLSVSDGVSAYGTLMTNERWHFHDDRAVAAVPVPGGRADGAPVPRGCPPVPQLRHGRRRRPQDEAAEAAAGS